MNESCEYKANHQKCFYCQEGDFEYITNRTLHERIIYAHFPYFPLSAFAPTDFKRISVGTSYELFQNDLLIFAATFPARRAQLKSAFILIFSCCCGLC